MPAPKLGGVAPAAVAAARAHALLALVMAPVAAAAAPAPVPVQRASQDDRDTHDDQTRARATMRIYADCLIARAAQNSQRTKLIAFLRVSPGPEASRAAQQLISSDCLRGAATATQYVARLKFKAPLLRGQIFRSLYLHLPRKTGVAPLSPADLAGSTPADDMAAALQAFGGCVVSQDRGAADTAIRMKPDSADETAAYAALQPALAACVSEGAKLKFSRAVLEGLFAEALYREAIGAPSAAAK